MVESDKLVEPPKLARQILAFATPRADRDSVLGDMEEAFTHKAKTSPPSAYKWYWSQTLKSCPYFLLRRMTSPDMKAVGTILLATLTGYACMQAWDILAVHRAAQYVAQLNLSLNLFQVRAVYFLTFMIGIIGIGAMIASLTFKRERTFLINCSLFLGPIMSVIVAESVVRFIISKPSPSILYFGIRVSLSCLALWIGAFVWMHLARRSDR